MIKPLIMTMMNLHLRMIKQSKTLAILRPLNLQLVGANHPKVILTTITVVLIQATGLKFAMRAHAMNQDAHAMLTFETRHQRSLLARARHV